MSPSSSFFVTYLNEFASTLQEMLSPLNQPSLDGVLDGLLTLRAQGGRLAVLGVGGSAANASHFTNDLRKIAWIDAYCPTDNVSEITARTNDAGFDTIFVEWLRTSKWSPLDAIFVLSVGGGNVMPPISMNLVKAVDWCRDSHVPVYGIVGRAAGHTGLYADKVIILPAVGQNALLTPFTEAAQSVICHALVSHPRMKMAQTKW